MDYQTLTIKVKSSQLQYIDEFWQCIDELMELEDVKGLHAYSQHFDCSRLQHSLNVAFKGFVICKKLGLDYKSAARAGLLHDLFLYDWREEKQPEGSHAFAHPVVALRNAMKNTALNHVEQDAILTHMWPLSKRFPKHRVSYIVSLSDKYCCCNEVIQHLSNKVTKQFKRAYATARATIG